MCIFLTQSEVVVNLFGTSSTEAATAGKSFFPCGGWVAHRGILCLFFSTQPGSEMKRIGKYVAARFLCLTSHRNKSLF